MLGGIRHHGLRVRSPFVGARLQRLGQAEVQDFDRSLRRDLDVGRLQIAVDDALLVGRLQGLRDLQGNLEGFVRRDGASADPLRQRRTLHQLQDERSQLARFLQAVDDTDVGMIERRQQLRFPLKPAQHLAIPDEPLRQNLERHLTAQLSIGGPIHCTHSAFAEFGRNLVMVDALSDQGNLCWIGVGKHGYPAPLPPNRTCGSPAYGSPVSRFLWIGRNEYGRHSGS